MKTSTNPLPLVALLFAIPLTAGWITVLGWTPARFAWSVLTRLFS